MLSYLENIFVSIGTFVSLFIFYTLVISFWGRLVIWGARLERKPRYGDPLTLVAGSALLAFVGWTLQEFTPSLRSYLLIFLYGGAFLAALELIILRLPWFFRQKDKKNVLAKVIQRHSLFLSAISLAVVMAFFHSAIWPSGQMESWLFGGGDYHNWPFLADYWQGLYDPADMNFTPNEIVILKDSFGTLILMVLWAMASGQTALFVLSGFLLTMVIWSGVSIIAIVRKNFSLGFWAAWAITIGVIGGGFYTYLVFRGQSGHLVAIVSYLVALRELFFWPDRPSLRDTVRFSLPIFLLFLTYQSGYCAFVFVLAVAAATRHFCQFNCGFSIFGLLKSGMAGVKPVILATLGSALLTPFLGYWLFIRTYSAAVQSIGWKLSFINPFLLSGIPFFRREFFDGANQLPSVNWWYFLFFAIILGLTFLASKKALTEPAIEIKNIYITVIIFMITIIMYIIGYYNFDNRYQVWKFIAYVGLPLSFVPTALLALVVIRGKSALFKTLFYGLLLCFIVFNGIKIDKLSGITELQFKFYDIMSSKTYQSAVRNIIKPIFRGKFTHDFLYSITLKNF
jgi:hypothetical protein